ncbi:polyphosphate polymerase domain-containing protein [Halalkalibacter sp. APA_J-10(15)]|uniref:polyphosphate polymerase domain-containing protein n=1 Tax=Halalkalibacter sp. APA_J-10(15) TaxID=2933805 RepID=UPI001FF5E361|nr:polyphosphate polymerase domain-containing protein [Halalkalibacter sp. APA_J-10(15)]MCK0470297.1 polyphosphate polymerase domain-containing protein [Halalkalibacter sp. APA_J-10(15)]
MAGEIFSRYELKYLIPYSMYEEIAIKLTEYMNYDQYGDEQGRYTIISLYFDSRDKKIYYETRNKARFRQKLRLRIYNGASIDDQAYFEVKKKYKQRVNKRRTSIQLRSAYEYIAGKANVDHIKGVSNQQIFREIDDFRQLYHLQPENIVSYDRQAFTGIKDKDLRVTFDYNLRCRNDDLHIEKGPHGHLFVDKDLVIMEVKVDHSVPLWLSRLLSEFECPKKSVSKFCTSADILEEVQEKVEIPN